MTAGPRIAIDAMGGDSGPAAMIAGAARALRKDRTLQFTFYGDEQLIQAELERHRPLLAVSSTVHSSDKIEASEKPSQAIRRARTTSMGMAINAVKEGKADAALSAGNTGALMAMSKLALRTMPGIDRPALAALLPTLGETDVGSTLRVAVRATNEAGTSSPASSAPTAVVGAGTRAPANNSPPTILGANTECDAQNLVQFAVMGAAYARTVLSLSQPRVKLLNIGTEELKGTDELKEAAALLREADYLPLRFDGFTEGDQLSRGQVDVVVTDGFSGNIALKTAEGTARFVTDLLRRAFTSSLRSKAGFALSRPALNLLKVHLDPNNHNGAVFLGLNGLVVKSHGSANPKGVANAIRVAASMVYNDITRKIGEDLDNFRAHAFANEAAQ